jgi:hypothetical protein
MSLSCRANNTLDQLDLDDFGRPVAFVCHAGVHLSRWNARGDRCPRRALSKRAQERPLHSKREQNSRIAQHGGLTPGRLLSIALADP